MIVLVCGGRDYADKNRVYKVLDKAHSIKPITKIVQGGARGADYLSKLWAIERGIPMDEYKADWDKYGKAAGTLRNKRMLDEADPYLVIVFPGGVGTAYMRRISEEKGVKVYVVE